MSPNARLCRLFALAAALFVFAACGTGKHVELRPKGRYIGTGQKFAGRSSWYGGRFNGRRTASGERFDMFANTAAHKTLPFGTLLRVTNPENDKKLVVRVNDRGPYHGDRVLDLSFGAAKKLGFAAAGTAVVEAEVVTKNSDADAKGEIPVSDDGLPPKDSIAMSEESPSLVRRKK